MIQVTDKDVAFLDTLHQQYFLPLEAKRAVCYRWGATESPPFLCHTTLIERECVMAYVIADTCIKDMLCVDVCPTDCIHPKKDEAAFENAAQLYIDLEG